MMYAIAYSDLVHPGAIATDPAPQDVARIAARILAHLMACPAERLGALKESLDNADYPELGVALLEGDHAEAGRIADKAARDQLTEDAAELAERYLNDDLTSWDKQRLAEWSPVKYASLGKRYHLAEMLS
jgi:hypothetical protein